MSRGAEALVLSGGPGYSDPWHPFERTSDALAELLRGAGHRVEITTRVAERLAELGDVDLLVVNAPPPESPVDPGVLAAASERLRTFVESGGAVLALHVGVTTLLGIPGWSSIVGARWLPERSSHPPLGPASVTRRADPRTGPAGGFQVYDERYSDLAMHEGIDVVVEHEHDGRTHPLIWTREVGRARVVADTLGHGPESLDSPGHREVLSRLVDWAVEPRLRQPQLP